MNLNVLKSLQFWAVLVLTNIGLVLAAGVFTSGTVYTALGWVVTILTALGYRGWKAPEEAAPAAPDAQ